MNLGQLKAHVRRITSVNDTFLLPDSVLVQYINEGYGEICDVEDWSFLRVRVPVFTVPNLPFYFFEREPKRVIGALVTSDVHQRVLVSTSSFPVMNPYPYPGLPAKYSNEGTAVTLFPTPDRVETVHFNLVLEPEPLVEDTDTPVFDDPYHVAIAYRAAIKVLAQEGDAATGSSAQTSLYTTEYTQLLARMQRRYVQNADRGVFQAGGAAYPGRRLGRAGWRR